MICALGPGDIFELGDKKFSGLGFIIICLMKFDWIAPLSSHYLYNIPFVYLALYIPS